MPEEHLDRPDVGPAFEQMRRIGVAKRVGSYALCDASAFAGSHTDPMHCPSCDRTGDLHAREHPHVRAVGAPILAEKIEQPRRETFSSAPEQLQARGLLGWLCVTVNEAIQIDGIALRRTLVGDLVITFPERRDSSGNHHPIVRPLGEEARRSIEEQIFDALWAANGGRKSASKNRGANERANSGGVKTEAKEGARKTEPENAPGIQRPGQPPSMGKAS